MGRKAPLTQTKKNHQFGVLDGKDDRIATVHCRKTERKLEHDVQLLKEEDGNLPSGNGGTQQKQN